MDIQEFYKTVMERPHRFMVIDKMDKELSYDTDMCPILADLETWQPSGKPNEFKRVQTKECYIDSRYFAKIRLYEYLLDKNGFAKDIYKPFAGTEIGKSIPILGF